jgi:oxygen-independent coproporphyrinogen-3 oxidase
MPETITTPSHLYLHIPFCQRRCAYCDFNTYANMENRIEAYVQALCAEIGMLADLPHSRPALAATPEQASSVLHSRALRPTIFFGGGTPSMLTPDQFERVLRASSALVPLDQAEITIEANPGSMLGAGTDALDYLRALRALGINRLSLGVQSLHDPLLRVLGRTHTAAEAYQCFNTARRTGFDNINLDFIFGLPGQTLEQWQQTLDTVAAWGTEHFSLYSLILEESTPMYAQVTSGHVSLPDNDDTAAMYESAIEYLGAAGYTQYEISNWARQTLAAPAPTPPAYACQHNLAYWLNSDYLAAGAGAHGHLFPQRYANICGIDAYIASVRAGQRPLAEQLDLTQRDLCAETMFMGLRLHSGVAFAHFRARCGVDMHDVFDPLLCNLCAQGLLERTTTGVRLTPRGRMLGNQVFAHFVS